MSGEPWTYYPALLAPGWYEALLPEFDSVCARREAYYDGRAYRSGRRMAVVADLSPVKDEPLKSSRPRNYSEFLRQTGYAARFMGLPTLDRSAAPGAEALRRALEETCGVRLDLAVVNLYDDGRDTIGWHSDAEALASEIVSVSLGASRTFRFRPRGATRGWSHEFELASGDVLWMHGPRPGRPSCQELYEHCVPPRAGRGKRLNLTFRQF